MNSSLKGVVLVLGGGMFIRLSKFTTLVIVMLKMLSALEVIVSRISSGREVLGEGGGSVMLRCQKKCNHWWGPVKSGAGWNLTTDEHKNHFQARPREKTKEFLGFEFSIRPPESNVNQILGRGKFN